MTKDVATPSHAPLDIADIDGARCKLRQQMVEAEGVMARLQRTINEAKSVSDDAEDNVTYVLAQDTYAFSVLYHFNTDWDVSKSAIDAATGSLPERVQKFERNTILVASRLVPFAQGLYIYVGLKKCLAINHGDTSALSHLSLVTLLPFLFLIYAKFIFISLVLLILRKECNNALTLIYVGKLPNGPGLYAMVVGTVQFILALLMILVAVATIVTQQSIDGLVVNSLSATFIATLDEAVMSGFKVLDSRLREKEWVVVGKPFKEGECCGKEWTVACFVRGCTILPVALMTMCSQCISVLCTMIWCLACCGLILHEIGLIGHVRGWDPGNGTSVANSTNLTSNLTLLE